MSWHGRVTRKSSQVEDFAERFRTLFYACPAILVSSTELAWIPDYKQLCLSGSIELVEVLLVKQLLGGDALD